MDWVCLVLDAHFTVLVMTPEAKGLLLNLHSFVKSQVMLFCYCGCVERHLNEVVLGQSGIWFKLKCLVCFTGEAGFRAWKDRGQPSRAQ